MAQRIRKRILLAQNFLKNPRTVRRLVSLAAIGPADTVYEIGPGRGIITAELARVRERLSRSKRTRRLVNGLRERFRALETVRIIHGDFLNFNIPDREYKIFASIPYNLTAAIVRKLLYSTPAPSEAYLIIQKEPARKFAGLPSETLFSLLAKPLAEFRILHQLRRTDFVPVPAVDSVLLYIRRREKPLLGGGSPPLSRLRNHRLRRLETKSPLGLQTHLHPKTMETPLPRPRVPHQRNADAAYFRSMDGTLFTVPVVSPFEYRRNVGLPLSLSYSLRLRRPMCGKACLSVDFSKMSRGYASDLELLVDERPKPILRIFNGRPEAEPHRNF